MEVHMTRFSAATLALFLCFAPGAQAEEETWAFGVTWSGFSSQLALSSTSLSHTGYPGSASYYLGSALPYEVLRSERTLIAERRLTDRLWLTLGANVNYEQIDDERGQPDSQWRQSDEEQEEDFTGTSDTRYGKYFGSVGLRGELSRYRYVTVYAAPTIGLHHATSEAWAERIYVDRETETYTHDYVQEVSSKWFETYASVALEADMALWRAIYLRASVSVLSVHHRSSDSQTTTLWRHIDDNDIAIDSESLSTVNDETSWSLKLFSTPYVGFVWRF